MFNIYIYCHGLSNSEHVPIPLTASNLGKAEFSGQHVVFIDGGTVHNSLYIDNYIVSYVIPPFLQGNFYRTV